MVGFVKSSWVRFSNSSAKFHLEVGDRVAYAAKFLKNTGQFTGPSGFRRGTFVCYDVGMPNYCRVKSNRKLTTDTRAIHPRALAALHGETACIALLGVARDLRSGTIPPEDYDQSTYCGSSCCIAGHVALRLGRSQGDWISLETSNDEGWIRLIDYSRPSDPQFAARAIEKYVYDGAEHPWD